MARIEIDFINIMFQFAIRLAVAIQLTLVLLAAARVVVRTDIRKANVVEGSSLLHDVQLLILRSRSMSPLLNLLLLNSW